MKVSNKRPDNFMLEYDQFFPLLSYYLPSEELQQNSNFVSWLRNTPLLADQYASCIEYNLPKPRHSHYQDEFKVMRNQITQYLTELEEFLGYYPV